MAGWRGGSPDTVRKTAKKSTCAAVIKKKSMAEEVPNTSTMVAEKKIQLSTQRGTERICISDRIGSTAVLARGYNIPGTVETR